MAAREALARGRAEQEEGRKAIGRSEAQPQPQRHLGRGMGRGRAWPGLSATQITAIRLDNPK